MHTIYVDADACPVKDEIYRVAQLWPEGRGGGKRFNASPDRPVDRACRSDRFWGRNDWIAGICSHGDIVVTADIPLAARSVSVGAVVIDPKGRLLNHDNVGEASRCGT